MRPIIITSTPNISWLNPSLHYPQTPDEFAEEAKKVERAGASILHVHAQGMWGNVIKEVKRKSGLIVQCGMSSLGVTDRMDVFTNKSDMISVILGHHDEAFVKQDFHVLHPREELIEYSKMFKKYGVKPEFEVWHAGHIWNLNYLINNKEIEKPYFLTLFFGWPGGNWTPPTIKEYLYRRSLLPSNSIINVSIMGKEQMKIIAAAVTMGDNVRVGTEDNPYINDRFATNEELVGQVVDLSRSIGRRVALPDEAAKFIGLKK